MINWMREIFNLVMALMFLLGGLFIIVAMFIMVSSILLAFLGYK